MGRRRGRPTRPKRRQGHPWAASLPRPRAARGPRWLRRILDWLDRPVGEAPDPASLIELTRVPRRMDAEAIVRQLELHGVAAHVFGADADGTAPHYGLVQGNRVMVQARDVERARNALSGR
ncbi:MAG: hypothetical protein AB7H43_06750 [Acidimicrobiia bacterium]